LITLRAIFARQRLRARRLGMRHARTGAVTFVQRFGSALNLNVHFHCVVPDGVWTRDDSAVRFLPLPRLTDDDVAQVLRRIEVKVRALLEPRLDALREDALPPDALAASQAESVSALRGKPPDAYEVKPLAAYHRGFSLHAGVHLHANNREGLAHLCGYGARPPLTHERLSALPDGRLTYRMKRRLGDGREMLILEPRELLRRLATLVPPPRAHLVRYHGVFGPASKWRQAIVPPAPTRACVAAAHSKPQPAPGPELENKPRRAPDTRVPWSELLLRVFRDDVLACPCGGRRKVIAFVHERPVIEKMLRHLGLPPTGPPTTPARTAALDQDAPWQDDVPELQQSLR